MPEKPKAQHDYTQEVDEICNDPRSTNLEILYISSLQQFCNMWRPQSQKENAKRRNDKTNYLFDYENYLFVEAIEEEL